MLLTITYEGRNTAEIGFLLHKNPERAQQFELSFGKAYAFYPEVSDERTTFALLLDIDPIDLAKGKQGSKTGGLYDYVNDRPYAASSFMSTAIARVLTSAMSGKCKERPALAEMPMELTAKIFSLNDGGNESLAYDIFEPLGYTVSAERKQLDDRFPEWGASPYIDLTIKGKVLLSDLLKHLYVLIPCFDKKKHYFIGEDEIDKLLRSGEGWLASHPHREKIVSRYLYIKKSLARKALERLLENELPDEASPDEAPADGNTSAEKKIYLNDVRLEAVKKAVIESGAASVLDLGCGECRLTAMLLKERQIQKIVSCDVCTSVLERAADRLHTDRMSTVLREKLTLIQGSAIYRDERFEGFDCVCLVEVIEHIDPSRLPAAEKNVFGYSAPKTVIVTTPNREYNVNYANMCGNGLRHSDHRFEWTRQEFRSWAEDMCRRYGYTVTYCDIGESGGENGSPTQMGVFTKNG